MSDSARYVMPLDEHNRLVSAVYQHRGYEKAESDVAAQWCGLAAWYGIKTHAALKALHLEELFGRARGMCVPGAEMKIEDTPRFKAFLKIDAGRKLGQPVAAFAMQKACELADEFGIGAVAVDNAFHYLWGGGYVIEAAKRGYIAYTNCTSALAEVVPFKGKYPTLGTNPHSWAFPTTPIVGFPIVMDFATSGTAMGRIQVWQREGQPIPSDELAVDADGNPTTDPNNVAALLPMGGRAGGHKGYGLALINELFAAYGGGSLPTRRGREPSGDAREKRTAVFYFQAIHPEALGIGSFDLHDARNANVQQVLDDILGHGNRESGAILPGEYEHNNAKASEEAGGLIFTQAEMREFDAMFREAGAAEIEVESYRRDG